MLTTLLLAHPCRFGNSESICSNMQDSILYVRKFYAIFNFPIFYLKPLNKNILYLLLSLNYRRDSILSLSLPAYLGSHTSKMRNNKPRVKQERESVKQIRGVFIAQSSLFSTSLLYFPPLLVTQVGLIQRFKVISVFQTLLFSTVYY